MKLLVIVVSLAASFCHGFVVPSAGLRFAPSSGRKSQISTPGRSRGTSANVRMFDEVGPQFANNLVQQEGWTYVDVRADYEFEHGRPAGAVNVPAFFSTAQGMTVNPDFVEQARLIAEKFPDKAAKLVIGCQMGSRSAQAAGWLENAGYSGIVNMEGGFSAWARDDSLPVEV
ncbi:unnamed protein product [Ectocarpus sp. 12 AP-2014]